MRAKYRLASHLRMSVARLDREISVSEMHHWLAFAQLEPFGCAVEDQRAGAIAAILYNVNRDADMKPLTPADFFVRDGGDSTTEPTIEQMSEVEIAALSEAFLAGFPGYAEAREGGLIS